MGNYRFKLSVQVRHPSADLAPIATAVGCIPRSIWKRGERRRDRQGHAIGEVMPSSYCTLEFNSRAGDDLDRAILDAVQALEPARALLGELQKSGGEVSVAIGWFSSGDSGDVVSPAVVQALASLGMSIHLHIYHEAAASD
jgi:hypothetical protein